MGGLLPWMLFYLVIISRVKGDCTFDPPTMFPGVNYEPDSCTGKVTPRCRVTCQHLAAYSTSNSSFVYCPHRSECSPRVDDEGDSCSYQPCAPNSTANCLHQIHCTCEGNNCTAMASLHYIAAHLHGSIMQEEDFSLWRYSMNDNFSDKNLSPEKYAAWRVNSSKSSDFNPRSRVDRELFSHIRNMTLAIMCIAIGWPFVYHAVNHFIERHVKKHRRRGRRDGRSRAEASADTRLEEFLRDEHLLYNWSRPSPLLTPIECYPKLFPIDAASVAAFLERPVRCGQSNDFLVLTA